MQGSHMSGGSIRVQFVMPPADLAPYITTFYQLEAVAGRSGPIEDWLHPEWANIRIGQIKGWMAGVGDAPLAPVPSFVVSGPTSLTTRFRVVEGRSWGIGLLPLGWAKFIGLPASDHTDRFVDGHEMALPTQLARLPERLAQAGGDREREIAIMIDTFRGLIARTVRSNQRIGAVHSALIADHVAHVSDLAEASGLSTRTLERLCKQVFGFSPQLLIRRQRFLRSLAKYMLDPSLSWIDALDDQYHDQAHFVRDFRRFMTMTPKQYSKLDHPILMAAMRGRMEAAGQPVQALHEPASGA